MDMDKERPTAPRLNGYNFTERVRKVLAISRAEAARLRHEYVGTEHILLGIIREGEGVAGAVLQNLDVDFEEVTTAIEANVKKGKSLESGGHDLPYTSRAKKVLELAMNQAREFNHEYVGTEHLLLGLLHEEKGIAAQVLLDHGVNLRNARAECLRLLGDESEAVDAAELSTGADSFASAYKRARDSSMRRYIESTNLAGADSLVLVADLDAVPLPALVELMASIDMLHRAFGGAGLVIDSQHVGAATAARELV